MSNTSLPCTPACLVRRVRCGPEVDTPPPTQCRNVHPLSLLAPPAAARVPLQLASRRQAKVALYSTRCGTPKEGGKGKPHPPLLPPSTRQPAASANGRHIRGGGGGDHRRQLPDV